MVDLLQQLTNLSNLLQITGIPGSAQPGQHIAATLAPPLGPLAITEIVQEDVSLDLIAKQVVFSRTDFGSPDWVADPDIAKILPLFNLGGIPPTPDASGTPGLVGRLAGKFPVAVPGEVLPTLTVSWTITNDADEQLDAGVDFLAPNGIFQPTLDIIFMPAFERFEGTIPPPVGRKLKATVTLAAGAEQVTRDLPPVRIEIPVLPFPQVLALTLHRDFQGAALILVPGASGVSGIDHLRALLQPIRNVVATLTSVARLAEMLLGIDTLTGILDAAHVEFRRGDRFDNLNDIDLIKRGFFENDTEAEDELSAFAYLAPPPSRDLEGSQNRVEMCNARNLSRGEGRFIASTGQAFVALCRNLHSDSPTVSPADAALNVTNAPSGWFVSGFGDELSSIRFI